MYLNHYHLKAKPFDLSPGPKFLWLGEKHKEALSTLNYGIMEDLGFLLLTGDVGVGKTALIHRLINSLDSSTIVAHITDPGLGTIDFFKLLAVEFNIPIEFHGKGEFLIELEKFLYAAYSDHKKVLLIVDEAQRLNNKLLDQIRVLSNIELSDRKLINIFFVGQPEFKTILMANSNRAIRQRIAINYHINPLTESETGDYIDHRLQVAGATRKIFKPNAIREIFRITGGFPRSINVICDHALVTGYVSGLNSIDAAVVEECEQELKIRSGVDVSWTDFQKPSAGTRADTRRPSPRRSVSMGYPILIGLCIALGALVSYFLLWPAPRWTINPKTQNKLVDAANQQTAAVAEAPPRVAEKTQKVPTQATPKNEITRPQLYKADDIQKKAAPAGEIAAADRPSAIFTAQARTAPGPLPDKSEVDSRVLNPGKAEKESALISAPSEDEPEIQTEKAAPNADIKKQAVPVPNEKIAPSDRQPAIFTAQASPAPDPLPYIPEVDNGVTGSGKAGATAAVVAVLTAKQEPTARKADTGAEGQAEVPAAEAAPEPAPPTDTPAVERPVTEAGKAAATVVAVLAANPKPIVDPPPKKEPAVQKAPPARKADTSANSQAAVPAAEASPKPAPSIDRPVVESDVPTPGKTGSNAAVIAVLAAAQPSSPVKPGTSVGSASAQSTSNVLKPSSTDNPGVSKSEGQATVSPSKTTAEETTPAEKVSSGKPLEASLSAKAASTFQSASEASGGTSATAGQLDVSALEDRLRSFLQAYCNTYAAKDIDRFTTFFAANAIENGKSFDSLVPKYERNFKFIEAIQYRIEMQDFSVAEDEQTIKIGGDFFLKWLPPDKQWRENSGKISMSLKENGSSFLVQRLDYQGGSSKKK